MWSMANWSLWKCPHSKKILPQGLNSLKPTLPYNITCKTITVKSTVRFPAIKCIVSNFGRDQLKLLWNSNSKQIQSLPSVFSPTPRAQNICMRTERRLCLYANKRAGAFLNMASSFQLIGHIICKAAQKSKFKHICSWKLPKCDEHFSKYYKNFSLSSPLTTTLCFFLTSNNTTFPLTFNTTLLQYIIYAIYGAVMWLLKKESQNQAIHPFVQKEKFQKRPHIMYQSQSLAKCHILLRRAEFWVSTYRSMRFTFYIWKSLIRYNNNLIWTQLCLKTWFMNV